MRRVCTPGQSLGGICSAVGLLVGFLGGGLAPSWGQTRGVSRPGRGCRVQPWMFCLRLGSCACENNPRHPLQRQLEQAAAHSERENTPCTPRNASKHAPAHLRTRSVQTCAHPLHSPYSSTWIEYNKDIERTIYAADQTPGPHSRLSRHLHAVCARFAQVCARFYTRMHTSNTARVRLHTPTSYAFGRVHTLKLRKHTLCTPLCTPKHASAHL